MSLFSKAREAKSTAAVEDDVGVEAPIWERIDVNKLSRKDLKNLLESRGLSGKGNKKSLRLRLHQAIQQEKEEELAFSAMVEARRRANAEAEASGSVYTCGTNVNGQLGQGDREPRFDLTVLIPLRGKGINHVAVGGDAVFAVNEGGDVYAWGGGGVGPLCRGEGDGEKSAKISEQRRDETCATPVLVEPLRGEGVVQIACGTHHATAVSDGGDCYVWGDNSFGQLMLGNFQGSENPQLVDALQDGHFCKQVCAGPSYTLVVTEEGKLFSCGLADNGKLGLNTLERRGVETKKNCFPGPTLVTAFRRVFVTKVACSSNHALAMTSDGVWTWGSGDGGRLGHGDLEDRHKPTKVRELQGHHVLDIGAGFWHSACIVLVPPARNSGWVYTWGSAFQGQLGQGISHTERSPKPVVDLVKQGVLATKIACGSHHNVVITDARECYSWGSNFDGCLGRPTETPFTAMPGRIETLDVIVDGAPRGPPCAIACGSFFTVVVTSRYEGPTEEEVLHMEEEEQQRLDLEEKANAVKDRAGKKMRKVAEKQRAVIEHLICDVCPQTCPGFTPSLFKPYICKECGYPIGLHNTPNPFYGAGDRSDDSDDG
tara:strand:+ start:211 stop:2007 length:1797 start_codon:yes stop_codon:yes gene_type:complete